MQIFICPLGPLTLGGQLRLHAPKEDLQYFNILNYIEFIDLFRKYRITLKCRISKMLVIFQYIEYIALDGPISKL